MGTTESSAKKSKWKFNGPSVTLEPVSITHVLTNAAPPISGPMDNNPTTGEDEYIKVIQPDIIDNISEIDLDTYIHTTYQVNDYVLRRYPPSKLGGSNPHKVAWALPGQVSMIQKLVSDSLTKPHQINTSLKRLSIMISPTTKTNGGWYDGRN